MTPWLRDFIDNRVFGPNHRWWALWVVVISVFIATTDVGMLTISLPVIITEFRTDITFAGWIVFVYALVTGALYLPCGRLSDLLGRKLTFSAGFLVYGIASMLAGLSQSPTQLMAWRVAQAIGAALMMTNTFALTGSLFTGADRGRAMGLSGGLVSALGFTLGPVVGGFITFTLGWRYIFFISGALSFIGFAAARFLLLNDRTSGEKEARAPFDFAGAALFAVGLTFLLLGITRGGLGYWGFPLSALFLALFVWREATCPYPILDLGLLRIVPFAVGNLARLCTFVALSTNELMMPFLLQLVLRMDPLEAGSLMTATALVLMVVSPSAGWLTDRIGSTLPRRRRGRRGGGGHVRHEPAGSRIRPGRNRPAAGPARRRPRTLPDPQQPRPHRLRAARAAGHRLLRHLHHPQRRPLARHRHRHRLRRHAARGRHQPDRAPGPRGPEHRGQSPPPGGIHGRIRERVHDGGLPGVERAGVHADRGGGEGPDDQYQTVIGKRVIRREH